MKRMYVIICGLLISFSNPTELSAHEKYLNLPHEVIHTLDYRYGSFDLIHSEEFYRRGRLRYNLVLQHRTNFLTITLSANGRVLNQNTYHHYPLRDHFCGSDCRFHFKHRHGAAFVSYNPFEGCRHHNVAANYQRYLPVSRYEQGGFYYHPEFRHYKRLKQHRHGYQAYNKRHGKRNGHGYYRHHKNNHQVNNRHWNDYHQFNSRVEKRNNRGKGLRKESHKNRHDHPHHVGSRKRGKSKYFIDPKNAYSKHYGG